MTGRYDDPAYTPGERRYFETRGEDASLLLAELGYALDSRGIVAAKTIEGRVLEKGDLVRLRSGGPLMTVVSARLPWGWELRGWGEVAVIYFAQTQCIENRFSTALLEWVPRAAPGEVKWLAPGTLEDVPPPRRLWWQRCRAWFGNY